MIAVVGPPITRPSARDAARHELSKAIYHRGDQPWPIRVVHDIERLLGRVADDVTRHSPGGGAGAIAILIVVVAVVAIVRWRLGPVQRTHHHRAAVLSDSVTAAADYRAAAETAAQDLRWNDAVIARLRAVARELEERGVVDPRPGRTADELAGEVAREQPGVAAPVRAAVDVFDTVAYGGRAADADAYDIVVAADRALDGRRMQVLR